MIEMAAELMCPCIDCGEEFLPSITGPHRQQGQQFDRGRHTCMNEAMVWKNETDHNVSIPSGLNELTLLGPRYVAPTELIVPCFDCGVLFDAINQARTDAFLGRRTRREWRCRPCIDLKIAIADGQNESEHQRKLEVQRWEWITNRDHGIPNKFSWSDFASFRMEDGTNADKVQRLRKWAQQFPPDVSAFSHSRNSENVKSLVLARDLNGVGKTHLAVSILREVINASTVDRKVSPFQFWTVGALRTRLAAAKRFGSDEDEEHAYHDLASLWLLVMDDVGKDRVNATDVEMYFRIINDRYNAGLPMIVTANVGFEPWAEGDPTLADYLGRAAASRLREMCGGRQFVIDGEDRR